MSTFRASNGQFWIDDQPVLIQAGEFHYFRTPPEEWRHRLGLLQTAGFNAVAAYIPWRWHELAEGDTDVDGHTNPLRNLAGFLDLATEMGFYIIARPGPYIMAETINEGIPDWVFSRYPGVALINQDHQPQNIVSYLHPDFLKAVAGWFRAVFPVLAPRQITRGGKIILCQLDNEMAMMHWVRNHVDLNPDTVGRFAAWVRAAYAGQWPAAYPAANLEQFLSDNLADPQPAAGALVLEDYRRFFRAYLREYMAYLIAQAQANGLEVPPVVNVHGFMNGGKTFPIGLSQLIEAMDLPGVISATDVYPGLISDGTFHQLVLLNEITKAVDHPDQPLFSIEFQAGGNGDFYIGQSSLADLHTRLCISTGMRAVNHYLFFDGENDPLLSPVKRHDWGHPVRKDGTLRRHYARYPKLSAVLNTYGEDLVRAQPETVTTIGFQLDDFMTEVNNACTRETANALIHQREDVLFDTLGKGLSLTHRPYAALELSRAELDPARTPLLWVMLDHQCDAAVQRKLIAYLQAGGRLVIAGRLPIEDRRHASCTLLAQALGAQAGPAITLYEQKRLTVFGHADIPASFVQAYVGSFESVFATGPSGETVGFTQRVGVGRALVLGAAIPTNTLEDLALLEAMAVEMGCPRLLTLSDWTDARLSRGERGSFLFLNNYVDDPVTPVIAYRGETLFGGQAVTVPARQGLILPLDWQVRPGITLHYSTGEITAVEPTADGLILRARPDTFSAELSLSGYSVAGAESAGSRVRAHSASGALVLTRTA